ncbi:hypothetical protein [Mycobacterium talmoniae]|uniref:hypothetical protein n=1 Tax=Mycobacterium talmoniae TaxID=1858794 RepID=UPI0013049619|nr:hypothetical protein [Mycobacterium talmoniae]
MSAWDSNTRCASRSSWLDRQVGERDGLDDSRGQLAGAATAGGGEHSRGGFGIQ